jgi:hypothetical protein
MDSKTQPGEPSVVSPPHFDFGRHGRSKRIREAAYFKAEKRGFAPGHELDDWLEAEQEIDEASTPLPSY